MEQKATSEEMCLGNLWKRCLHSEEYIYGLRAAEFQVKNIPEKNIVVILCQDGISGWEEQAHEDDDDDDDDDDDGEKPVERARDVEAVKGAGDDQLRNRANELLRFRWDKTQLMDAIVKSDEFAKGDYKGSIKAGFERVDKRVAKVVDDMPKEMDGKIVDWSEPIVWQAQYNSVVVIVTPEEVHMAGSGSFIVLGISKDDVTPLSSLDHLRVSSAKSGLACGFPPTERTKVVDDLLAYKVQESRKATVEETYRKYELEEKYECIIVEPATPGSRTGGLKWLRYGKDWRAALEDLSHPDWMPGMHFDAMVLELKVEPEKLSASRTVQVPSTAFFTPTKKMARSCSSATGMSPVKRLQMAMEEPPPLMT